MSYDIYAANLNVAFSKYYSYIWFYYVSYCSFLQLNFPVSQIVFPSVE